MTIKRYCSCSHESQDKMYGNGIRVFNYLTTDSVSPRIRCTVCGTVIRIKGVNK